MAGCEPGAGITYQEAQSLQVPGDDLQKYSKLLLCSMRGELTRSN